MIANKNEAKALPKYISCDCKWKLNSATCHSNQRQNNNTYQCECENSHKCKKDYSQNLTICVFESIKYLKRIADTLVAD